MGLPVSRVTSYSQHVLWYHLVATQPEWIKSLCLSVIPGSVCWHTQYSRIYNRGKSHVKSNVNTITSIQIAEVTRLWIPINTNGKVECSNRNPNVSLTRRKDPATRNVAARKRDSACNMLANSHHREMMNKGYHYMHIWLVEKLYGYNVFAKSQFFPTAKE